MKNFLLSLNTVEEVTRLKFDCCPFDVIGVSFINLIKKFPNVRQLNFQYCQFDAYNFLSVRSLNTVWAIKSIRFSVCTFPEETYFINFLKGQKFTSFT
eukprot:snap_masked-scaffold_6-processed-gene-4.29-mRNA-1 protein AED:1.00 eAED:1.00 QI:0/0/0/0/1/1/4/0/97